MPEFVLESDLSEIIAELGDVVDDFAGKTILLAGGCGFLGRYFVRLFEELSRSRLAKPARLVVLDNLITSGQGHTALADSPSCRFVEHDVSTPLELDEQPDYVVHAAGIASPMYYRKYPLQTLDVAVLGNRHLLDVAHENGARYTFFSSSEIYGDPDPAHVPTSESYRGNVASQGDRACYDESKRVGETICYIYHEKYGVPTSIIRPFNVYGPGMQEADYRVLPNFASCIKSGRKLAVYGSGRQTRTFCYVTDAINGFLRVIARGRPGETYNIGNPQPEISMAGLVERMSLALGRPVDHEVIDYPEDYPGDEPSRRCPDITKAASELGYIPRVDLDTGLKRFLSWTDLTYTAVN